MNAMCLGFILLSYFFSITIIKSSFFVILEIKHFSLFSNKLNFTFIKLLKNTQKKIQFSRQNIRDVENCQIKIDYSKKIYKIGLCRKKSRDNFVHLKKIYKFTSDHFLIGDVVFVLIVKNALNNEEFHFVPNLSGIRNKIVCFEEIYKFAHDNFSIDAISCFSMKNIFLKIKYSIFPPKYTRDGKTAKEQNFLL